MTGQTVHPDPANIVSSTFAIVHKAQTKLQSKNEPFIFTL